MQICGECKTPQECGVVKSFCPIRMAAAQNGAHRKLSVYEAMCEAYNSSYGLGYNVGALYGIHVKSDGSELNAFTSS